jgi:hypothetical protein
MDAPPLPTDVATLQAMVRELLATVADLRTTVAAQQHRIDDLTRRLYGRKSERVTADPPAPAGAPTPPPSPQAVRLPRKRGHGRRPAEVHAEGVGELDCLHQPGQPLGLLVPGRAGPPVARRGGSCPLASERPTPRGSAVNRP